MKRACDRCGWHLPGPKGHGFPSANGKSIGCPGPCPPPIPKSMRSVEK